uniref:Kazal-like domain-containing protein n=1 Tax=Photinus pyralis TaxID=7054 RepID=A0A1Y1MRQ7_PHOPY
MKILYAVLLLFPILPFVHNQRHFHNHHSHGYSDYSDYDHGYDDAFDGVVQRSGFNENRMPQDNSFATPTRRPISTTTGAATRTRPSACEERCPVAPQYSPVCGSNGVTYNNIARFQCAQRCGRNIEIARYGVCSSTLALA